jgi:hypothetical protein
MHKKKEKIMITIKFFKRVTEFRPVYDLEDGYNNLLQELAIFLDQEVSCFGSFRLMRLINALEEGDETSGNLMTLERRGNNLLLGNVYYNGPEDEQEYFVIPIAELEKLMKKWEKLMKELPDEITLSMQNGHFDLVGENYFQKK